MKIENVLYIVPSTSKKIKKDIKNKLGAAPLGVAYISSMLKLHGYNTYIIDDLIDEVNKQKVDEIILNFKPNVICISGAYTQSIKETYKISQYIKKSYPNIILLTGGAHVTFLPQEALENGFDYVILREGESSTVQLFEYLNYSMYNKINDIKGIAYINDNGEFIINSSDDSIQDLDGMPFPDLSDLNISEYATPLAIITSRGCPGNCVYCASKELSGRKYRCRSAESVFSEVYYLYDMQKRSDNIIYSYLAIYDDTFTVNYPRLKKFCQYMIDTGLSKQLKWKCESRIDILNEEKISLLRKANCFALHIGLESYNQNIIDSLNKHIKVEHMEEVIRWISNNNMQPLCSFIVGNHLDTHETLEKTRDFIRKIIKDYGAVVALSVNTPLPGTDLFDNSEKYNINLTSKNWSDYSLSIPIIETKFLSNEEIRFYYMDMSQEVEVLTEKYVKNRKRSKKVQ